MDPYTARCLQVSTNVSDTMPPQRRLSSNLMKRQGSMDSRVSVRPVHHRSNTSVSGNIWGVQTDVPTINVPSYPQPSTTPLSMHSSRFPSPIPPATSPFESQGQMSSYMTPITPYTPNEWNVPVTLDGKQLQGLGMDLSEQSYVLNSTEGQEDIIHINAPSMWEVSESISPGRRSSTAGSDGTEGDSMVHSAAASAYDGMLGGRDDRRSRSRSAHRSSRSLSRTPISRAASKRAHRRQLSCAPVPHGRAVSVGAYMPTVPQTPTDGLVMDFSGHTYMQDPEMGMEPNYHHNSFDAMMEVPMMPTHSNSGYASRFTTPPNDLGLWDNSAYETADLLSSPSNHSDQEHHDGCCSASNNPGNVVEDEEKPDLFESLRQEPSNPPEEDMHPEDPDMVPQEQEPRFEGDMYTPRWVRGQGNKREGYCGLCKPGRWLVLKNSAYWYDKSFTHGISAATGQPFEAPRETRRMAGNPDVWEGLCGGCGEWIALVSSKKKGTTWFRHAYKCHSKSKDKKGRPSPPITQVHPYANMKPVPMSETAIQQMPHHDMFAMSHMAHPMAAPMARMASMPTMPSMPMMDMHHHHPGDTAAFSEMTFL